MRFPVGFLPHMALHCAALRPSWLAGWLPHQTKCELYALDGVSQVALVARRWHCAPSLSSLPLSQPIYLPTVDTDPPQTPTPSSPSSPSPSLPSSPSQPPHPSHTHTRTSRLRSRRPSYKPPLHNLHRREVRPRTLRPRPRPHNPLTYSRRQGTLRLLTRCCPRVSRCKHIWRSWSLTRGIRWQSGRRSGRRRSWRRSGGLRRAGWMGR